MAKFLLFSDIHVHPHKHNNQRLNDCLSALDWVFREAKAHKVDAVLFGGDLLHDRQKIDSLTYMGTFKVLEKYQEEKFQVYLLLGNHDLWFGNSTKISSTYPFGALKNFEVIDSTQSRKICGDIWHFMPYTHDPIEELKKLPLEEIASSYLLGHLSIDGARLNSAGSIADVSIENDGDMVKVGPSLFKGYKHAFFGHYHGAQKLAKNIEYIGSPLQLSFGEADESKHIILLDTNLDDITYIENTFSPRHFYLTQDDYQSFDKDLLKNAFVDITISDITDVSLKKDLEKFSEENNIATVRVRAESKQLDEHVVSDVKKILSDEKKLLENYLEQQAVVDLDKDMLLDIGRKVIAHAEAQDNQ